MPISNLMIQRRRLNELRRLGFDKAEPDKMNEYELFRLYKGIITREEIDALARTGFFLGYIMVTNIGDHKGNMEIIVKKSAPEKQKAFARVEITN